MPMYSRKDALQFAIQQRRCPPASTSAEPESAEKISWHRKICPYCSGEADKGDSGWNDLVKSFENHFRSSFSRMPDQPVSKGDIRFLQQKDNPWSRGFYFNPPAVLVLEKPRQSSRLIPVAQIFEDPVLAGPGDLIEDEFFIETWNMYYVHMDDIGPVSGRVDDEIVSSAVQMSRDPGYLPSRALLPAPIKSDDPRLAFRTLETGTADFFKNPAPLPALFLGRTADTAAEELRQHVQGIKWDTSGESIWEVLSTAEPPEGYFPRAAADRDLSPDRIKAYIFKDRHLREIRKIEAEVQRSRDDTSTTFSVFFPAFPGAPVNAWGYAVAVSEENRIVKPEMVKFSFEKNSLAARFTDPDLKKQNFRPCVIFEYE